MSSFPDDLLTEILLRLPAKTLLRFKVVCKLWYNLITNVYFVNLHLQRSLTTKTNLHLLVTLRPPLTTEPFVVKTPTLHFTDFDTFENTRELDYPFKNQGVFVIVSTVNGLVCLCHRGQVIIYNPTTQTNRFLPLLPIEEKLPRPHDIGFGFDTISQDYKCVWIREFRPVWQVRVYSLNNHSWRRLPDADFFCSYPTNVLLHETIYWVGVASQIMVAFSLQDENFSYLTLPEYQVEHFDTKNVTVLDGHLCLSVSYYDYCDVWIMEEYGVVGSWKKVFNFRHESVEFVLSIVSYSSNGKGLFVILLGCDSRLAHVDLETMQITYVQVADFVRHEEAHLCVENLLMLDHANYINVEEEEQGQEEG